ncbi:hypothetical protein QFC22_005504 [Naganishia vaughanmartiniae]|uniref:Uncharacterized protein n=1 Tax=Naganishia vaughanmartiniae TaxID=1424756 RepID=A0ACC2WU41_9TREE|nr:hypothetical protein QFC22_005504 [Naganishia vaughanmartiniae]
MGKQSTLGKFWGKAGASDQIKADEEKKTDEKVTKAQEAEGNGNVKAVERAAESPVASAVESKPLSLNQPLSETKSVSSKAESSKKKRRIVESDDEEEPVEGSGDLAMESASQEQTIESSSKVDEADVEEPPKKRARTQDKAGEKPASEEAKAEKIREEVKEAAKAQIDQIKEAPENSPETVAKKTAASVPSASKGISTATQKSEGKNSAAKNPFSLAKAGTTSKGLASANTKKPAAGVAKKGTIKAKPDPDDDEDEGEQPHDKNYQPVDGKETPSSDEDDEDLKAKIAEDEDEEDGEAVDDEEDEKTAKVTASKLAATLALSSSASLAGKLEWKKGDPVPYSALTDCFEEIDKTTKRTLISSLLTTFLLKVAINPGKDGGDLLRVVYLCINRLCPDYMGVELGIGESLIIKAVAQCTGRSVQQIKNELRTVGDLGLVAQQSRGKQKTLFKTAPLTVPFVFKCLTDIAKATGNASQAKKVGIIQKLLTPCTGSETKFIVRSLEGKLRIGLAEKTLVTALAHAIVLKEVGSKKLPEGKLAEKLAKGAEAVKAVYSELPNYDLIVPALMKGGIEGLKEACKLTPGVPLKPMLAKPTKAIGEVLDRFEGKEFTCEYKYDGERAQIHMLEDGQIVVFSRNSENMSAKYPDLLESIPRCVSKDVKTFVIDAEAVAYDIKEQKLLPFQQLTTRKRKDVRTEDITVRVHIFAFDLLYLNGESLLQKELVERRRLLQESFHPVQGEFGFAKSSDGSSSEQIAEFLDESIKDGCEGLMVKRLTSDDSTYEPSRRSINWLKLKKDYLAGVGDSCDLVVVGGYYGKGKRTNTYGAFLLACYDADAEQFQTACKIGTGFSDQMLVELYNLLSPLELASGKRSDVQADMSKPPDVWFEPKVVFEVLTADLTLSPIYMAGHGLVDERGISLRFPRFIKIREDKDADDATTSEQIAEFYEAQALASKGNRGGGGNDEY